MRSNYDFNEMNVEIKTQLLNSQDISEKMKYKQALEAASPSMQAKLVSKLYEFCTKPNDVDYGKILDSKGNIFQLKNYSITEKCIETLNKLMEITDNQSELKLLNDFNDMLIKCRSDFEYGFRFNIELIKVLYKNMVLTLYELIDICIISYSDYVKDREVKKPMFKPNKKKDLIIIKSAKGYLAAYKSGEWKKVMDALKDPKLAAIGESYLELSINNFGYAMESPLSSSSSFSDIYDNGKILIWIIGLIAILNFLRWSIRWFMMKSARMSTYLEKQADLLKQVSEMENRNGRSTKEQDEQREKFYIFLHNTAEFLNNKILKLNTNVENDIMKDNKKNYNLAAMDMISDNNKSQDRMMLNEHIQTNLKNPDDLKNQHLSSSFTLM